MNRALIDHISQTNWVDESGQTDLNGEADYIDKMD